MSIYGIMNNNYDRSTIGEYLSNNFLESCLSDESKEISEKIIEFTINKDVNRFDFMMETIIDIQHAPLSENAKNILIEKLCDAVKESGEIEMNKSILESTEVLMEFQGNAEKNKEFVDILKEVEELCDFNIEKIRKCTKYLEVCLSKAKEIEKSPKKFKQLNDEIRKMNEEYNNWYDKASKTKNAQVTCNNLRKKLKMFNNKYSTTSMDEKKKLDSKLNDFIKEINKLVDPWLATTDGKGGEKFDEFKSIFKNLYDMDKDYASSLGKYVNDFMNIIFDEQKYTIQDIYYFKSALDLDIEKGIIYKVVNKLLK